MLKLLCTILLAAWPLVVQGACIDVVDLSVELPPQDSTAGGVLLSYRYDLVTDQYSISWRKAGIESDWFGPFPLTMACGTAALRWENDSFLLFEKGCGTFCWYADVFYLGGGQPATAPGYQRVERPLAFDRERDLLAYYASHNHIRIRNLHSGQEQEIRTEYDCEFRSGMCITDIRFDGNSLSYSWRSEPAGEVFFVELDAARLGL